MVMYFLLCNMGVPAAPPPLRDFALLACLICSLEECFIRDAVKGLVPRTRVGVPVASVTGRATATNKASVLEYLKKLFEIRGVSKKKLNNH